MAVDEDDGADVVDLTAKLSATPMKVVKWVRLDEKERPISCVENVEALLKTYGVSVRLNLMTHEVEHTFRDGFKVANDAARNAHEAQVREWCRLHGVSKGQPFADQMALIIGKNYYHPVADWIRSKPWDGVDRILPLFDSLTLDPTFREAHENIAFRLLEAWMVTAAKAALLPADAIKGVKAQGVLVLQGPQGKRKTQWLMALVPKGTNWAQEAVTLDPHDRDSRQQATSTWQSELGEIDSTFKKDFIALKGFITQPVDKYRKAYARCAEDVARRTVFTGSVNPDEFLPDETGNRRWWTIKIVECNPDHGLDLQQLWAQVARIAETEPERGWLNAAEQAALEEANKTFETLDPLADDVLRVFEICPEVDVWKNFDQIRKAIRPGGPWNKSETTALGKALQRLKVPERRGHAKARLFALSYRPAFAPASETTP